jgi:hypothetical protein
MNQIQEAIVELINSHQGFVAGQRESLLTLINELSFFETFKLKKALEFNQYDILQAFIIRSGGQIKIDESTPIKVKVEYVSHSLLSNPQYLGIPFEPIATDLQNVLPPDKLVNINDLRQLARLDIDHILFNINESPEYNLKKFSSKLEQMAAGIKSANEQRNIYVLFMSSPLYIKYITTGLTALAEAPKRPVPNRTLLNILHSENPSYLSHSQFAVAALVSWYIRKIALL